MARPARRRRVTQPTGRRHHRRCRDRGGWDRRGATAFFVLRETPHSVLLIERNRVARGATGRNAGQMTTYFERPGALQAPQQGHCRDGHGVGTVARADLRAWRGARLRWVGRSRPAFMFARVSDAARDSGRESVPTPGLSPPGSRSSFVATSKVREKRRPETGLIRATHTVSSAAPAPLGRERPHRRERRGSDNATLCLATVRDRNDDMPRQLFGSDRLTRAVPYHYTAAGTGEALVFSAGACPLDGDARVVAVGDIQGQARQALANLSVALEDTGCGHADVVKTTIFVASSSREDLVLAWDEYARVFGTDGPPSTLLGVAVLGWPGQLVEIEAVAVRG